MIVGLKVAVMTQVLPECTVPQEFVWENCAPFVPVIETPEIERSAVPLFVMFSGRLVLVPMAWLPKASELGGVMCGCAEPFPLRGIVSEPIDDVKANVATLLPAVAGWKVNTKLHGPLGAKDEGQSLPVIVKSEAFAPVMAKDASVIPRGAVPVLVSVTVMGLLVEPIG